MKYEISTKLAPAAIGPYSQANLVENASKTLYISGQLGIDPASGELLDTLEAQTHQAMKNLGAILQEAGMSYANIAKTTIFLTDLSAFSVVNEIYQSYLVAPYPARACFEVSKLPKNALVEIEAVAVI